MAVRLMTYLGLLYQDLLRTGPIHGSELLPAILPLVLYNGKQRWTAPVDLRALIEDVPGGLERYRPSLHYLLIDELRWAGSELTCARNAVAALFRLERSRQPEDVRRVLHELAGWLRAPEQASLRRDFAVWFARTFLPGRAPGKQFPEFNDIQEVDAMGLSETVIEWTKQWEEEGRLKGRKEEQRLFARRLLARETTVAEVAELTGLSAGEVEALRRG